MIIPDALLFTYYRIKSKILASLGLAAYQDYQAKVDAYGKDYKIIHFRGDYGTEDFDNKLCRMLLVERDSQKGW
jgi:hypothetical protein